MIFEPLASRLRPLNLEDFVGQEHILGENSSLRKIIKSGRWHSLLFWGPTGVGKTTLARIAAAACGAEMVELSAVSCGVKELREAILESSERLKTGKTRSVLFVDEIHRLNKSQQDVLLPAIEKGVIGFIGATSENPSFEVNPAILSRTLTFRLDSLSASAMSDLLRRAAQGQNCDIAPEAMELLLRMAGGDARRGLNILEGCLAALNTPERNLPGEHKTFHTAQVRIERSSSQTQASQSADNGQKKRHVSSDLFTEQLFSVDNDLLHHEPERENSGLILEAEVSKPSRSIFVDSEWNSKNKARESEINDSGSSTLLDRSEVTSPSTEDRLLEQGLCLFEKLKGSKLLSAEFIKGLGLDIPLGHREHYDLASAMIKSLRASHPDAGLYYMARLIEQGDDPMFIARRLVIFASEDVGNANPEALQVAASGASACQLVGFPEARIILSQVLTYLAASPKSNRSYLAIGEALECVKKSGKLPIPGHILNPVTTFNKQLGLGRGYDYPHDHDSSYRLQSFLPPSLKGVRFYRPAEIGTEKLLKKNLEALRPVGDDLTQ